MENVIDWIARRLEAGFSRRGWLNAAFFPLSLLYRAVICLRRWLYQYGPWQSIPHPGIPVIVIGNIYVGGTGKTPLIIALASRLKAMGFLPGIISRGYTPNSTAQSTHRKITGSRIIGSNDSAAEVGDEPLLILQQTGLPVAIGSNRRASAARLKELGCDILLSDDGLQHYALKRDIEIAVVDAQRGHGNGWLLPAGPLREPVRRLQTVDWVVYQGGSDSACSFELKPSRCVALGDRKTSGSLESWRGETVHAVAGIGNPERFFTLLRGSGVEVIPHPFPDHYEYSQQELMFEDGLPVLMTAKDAVKCHHFDLVNAWIVEVILEAENSFYAKFDQLLTDRAIQPRLLLDFDDEH